MDIRKYFGWEKPYYLVSREERNLCAVLYYLLLSNNNLSRFLDWLGATSANAEVPAIYFEYSHLRDIWHGIGDNQEKKQSYILDALSYPLDHQLRAASFYDFNSYFGAVKEPSRKYIQSPGNWAISRYDHTIRDNDEFLRVSRFKWCFNAKPDIVIHLGDDKAICIEGKFESGEGFYPGTEKDKAAFSCRSIDPVSQTEIQRYIFELLGIDCDFFFLVANVGNGANAEGSHRPISWQDVFGVLDRTGAPTFISAWVDRFKP